MIKSWSLPTTAEQRLSDQEVRHYANLAMRVLANDHAILDRGGSRLVVASVIDLSASHAGFPEPDLETALQGAPVGVPVILLDHQPRDARRARRPAAAFRTYPWRNDPWTRSPRRAWQRRFVSGRYDVDGMTLFVNNSTGLWPGFALRLGRLSELTRITLRGVA